MDEFGNISIINQVYQYPDIEISSSEIWSENISACGNIIIKSSGNLTIQGSVITLDKDNYFEVEVGGELLITEGSIQ